MMLHAMSSEGEKNCHLILSISCVRSHFCKCCIYAMCSSFKGTLPQISATKTFLNFY